MRRWIVPLVGILLSACASAPPPPPEYVGVETICITVQPHVCRGVRTTCGPVERTARLIGEWCAHAYEVTESATQK